MIKLKHIIQEDFFSFGRKKEDQKAKEKAMSEIDNYSFQRLFFEPAADKMNDPEAIKKLKGSISSRGYKQFTLNWKEKGLQRTYGCHVLVAMSFLNHQPNGNIGLVVDHIDDNKLNNNVNNLQLLSSRENNIKKGIGSNYYGVWKSKDRFTAGLFVNKKKVYLGRFVNEYDAHLKVLSYMKEHNIKRIF